MRDRVHRFLELRTKILAPSLESAEPAPPPDASRKESVVHLNRVTASAAIGALALTISSAVLPVSAQANDWTPTDNPGVTVWGMAVPTWANARHTWPRRWVYGTT